jgi:hypothetical protein
MPRPQKQNKPWFKFWSRDWLEGSIRFECTAAERGIFTDLLAMANESRNRGIIQMNETMPYPHSWIASILNIPIDTFEAALEKLKAQERIEETSFGLKITNFAFYQREFTKPGRPPRMMKSPEKKEPDSKKYTEGRYGQAVCQTPEDIERIRNIRKNLKA